MHELHEEHPHCLPRHSPSLASISRTQHEEKIESQNAQGKKQEEGEDVPSMKVLEDDKPHNVEHHLPSENHEISASKIHELHEEHPHCLPRHSPSLASISRMQHDDQFEAEGEVSTEEKEKEVITEENENEDFGDFKTVEEVTTDKHENCLLYTSPSPRDRTRSRMPSSA